MIIFDERSSKPVSDGEQCPELNTAAIDCRNFDNRYRIVLSRWHLVPNRLKIENVWHRKPNNKVKDNPLKIREIL
ncbi:MAG: hypothetical protein DRH24_04220 [Deltaproteobacteria bacterium]|nr:MAG: hypothetical protein DRH24_04220 [Deltaproteobacteria bacterium]